MFERNPIAIGTSRRSRNITQRGSSALDGVPILFEGQPSLPSYSFSGFTDSPAEYAALLRWFEKSTRAIRVIDDLGRSREVLLVTFSEGRLTSGEHHRWTLGCLVLAVGDQPV